jgi:molybdenum cofactor cytidylyltransferase
VIAAVVLAAGLSSRMGRPKATLRLPSGRTFVVQVVQTLRAAGVDEVVVVAGHAADAVTASIMEARVPARVVVNQLYVSGQWSSVIAGLDAVDRPDVEAMLLTLVDVPLVSAETISALMDRYRSTRAPVVRPVSRGRHGHPVLIGRALFNALRAADPVLGAKPLVRVSASDSGDVEVEDEGAFLDIDTAEDYQRLFAPGESG